MTVTMIKMMKIKDFQHAKNGAPFLSIKSIEEEIEGYLYRTVAEVGENGVAKEFAYKVYLTHKASFKDGKFSFERSIHLDGKPYNYSKEAIKRAVINIIPISEGNGQFNKMMQYSGEICKIINSAYALHETEWMTADKA